MFSIISTLKTRGRTIKKEFVAVPQNWIINNYVYWPKTNLTKLLADGSSAPDIKTWTKSKCCVHQKNVSSHDEALMWEEKYTEVDTEDEVNLSISILPKNTFKADENAKQILSNNEPIFGSSMLIQTSPSQLVNQISSDYDQMFESTNSIIFQSPPSPLVLDNNNIIEAPIEPTAHTEEITHDLNNVQLCNCSDFHTSTQNSINRLTSEIVSLKLILERMEKNIRTNDISEHNKIHKDLETDKKMNERFLFPIENTQELKRFDDVLQRDNEYKKYLVDRFGKICGKDGNEKASDKVSVKLASEILFTKQLLTEISWTGVSRTANIEQKIPFRIMIGILSLVEEVMQNCDSRWNRTDTEKLFREKLLKHSKKRNLALLKKNGTILPEEHIEISIGNNSNFENLNNNSNLQSDSVQILPIRNQIEVLECVTIERADII